MDELRGQQLGHPNTVKDFLRLRLASLEHEVCGLMLLDNQFRLITYLEPFRGTLAQAAVYHAKSSKSPCATTRRWRSWSTIIRPAWLKPARQTLH